jgi:hypothetical protein
VELFLSRWHEHVMQKHLYLHDKGPKRDVWLGFQRQLCEKTLERAKLEVQLYEEALRRFTSPPSICKSLFAPNNVLLTPLVASLAAKLCGCDISQSPQLENTNDGSSSSDSDSDIYSDDGGTDAT